MSKSSGRGPTLAKNINRKRVYQFIKQQRNTSRVAAAKQLHLNKNTVNSIVDEMLAHHFIKEFGPQDTHTAGRKPIMISFNAAIKWSIGVQITSTVVHWAVTDLYAKPLETFSVPLPSPEPEHVVTLLQAGINQLLAKYPAKQCVGLCVGIPGLLTSSTGTVIRSSHLGWRNVPFYSMLKPLTNLPLKLDHSIKLASLGELWHGSGQEIKDFVYCYFGNGVGSSLIANGSLVRGNTNTAGELGHIVVDAHGPICGCGNTGCLEAWVKLPAMIERIASAQDHKPIHSLSIDQLFVELEAGDPVVTQEFARTGQYIGQALSYLVNLLNPKLIIFDGPLMQASSHLFPTIHRQLQQLCMSTMLDQLLLVRSKLYPFASCIGAAASMIQAWEDALLTFEATT